MKNLLMCVGIAVILAGCAGTQQKEASKAQFSLTGNIIGQADGMVFLERYEDGYVTVDSAKLTEGSFAFSGNVEVPQRYYLKVPGQKKKAAFFLEPGNITVSSDIDSLNKATVKGSALQDEYVAYNEEMDTFRAKFKTLREDYSAAKAAGDEAQMKSIMAQGDSISKDMEAANISFIEGHSESPVAAYVAYSEFSFKGDHEEIETIMNKLSASLEKTPYVISMHERVDLLKRVAIGQPAIGFTQNDTSGNSVSLESFKGKYLLIDFWASWCGPCRRANPDVVAIYEDFKDQDFDIIGVSLDTKKPNWVKAIHDDQLAWAHVSDLKGWDNEVSDSYGVKSIPHTILLDKDGIIIAKTSTQRTCGPSWRVY